MSDYIPTAQWLAARPVPDGGAAPTSALFGLSFEDIYDRLEWLKNGNAAEVTLTAFFSAAHGIHRSTEWRWDSTLCALEQIEIVTGAPNIHFDLPIRVPHGSRIAQVDLALDPTAHGSLPGNRPQFDLRSIDLTGTVSNHGGATDASGSGAAYSNAHTISRTWAAPDQAVDRASDYLLKVRGESGSNSATGLMVFGALVTIVTSARDLRAG